MWELGIFSDSLLLFPQKPKQTSRAVKVRTLRVRGVICTYNVSVLNSGIWRKSDQNTFVLLKSNDFLRLFPSILAGTGELKSTQDRRCSVGQLHATNLTRERRQSVTYQPFSNKSSALQETKRKPHNKLPYKHSFWTSSSLKST